MKAAALILVAHLAVTGIACHAETWPGKPIRMLVGFPPGGPTDVAHYAELRRWTKVAPDAGLKAE